MKRFLAPFLFAVSMLFAMAPALLIGCSGMNSVLQPLPDGPNAKVAAALSSVTTARELLAVAVNADKISAADADNLRMQINTARSGIDLAQTAFKTDMAGGDARLSAARAAIDGVRAYLISKGTKP